jgi:hypothetical protein
VQGAKRREWLSELRGVDGFVADVEGVEDGLVDEPADLIIGAAVELGELFVEDLQCEVEGRDDVLVADAEAGDELLGVFAALADAGLFLVE